MTELLTAAQMRSLEQGAIRSGHVTGLELMERAGQGVVDAIFNTWPALRRTTQRAIVLCGPGNNGGDGFVVARLLFEWGWPVEVHFLGQAEKLPPDARTNFDRWCKLGTVQPSDDTATAQAIEHLGQGDVVVDALFGIGLTRPFDALPQTQMALNDAVQAGDLEDAPHVVAVDMPSGYDVDAGRLLSTEAHTERNFFAFAPIADLTVTFHAPKVGHLLAQAQEACGTLKVVDIGLNRVADEIPIGVHLANCAPAVLRKKDGHKFTHGHAVVLSGPASSTGAARLAARGALRIGAGLVTVASPGDAMRTCAAHLTAIMLRRCDTATDLTGLLNDKRINALCLGPGLGIDRAAELVRAALDPNRASCATVLDADALSAFAENPKALFELLHETCVLTPHAGEFQRLFPDIHDRLTAPASRGPAFGKLDATREAALRTGCVVVFKGSDTVIAHPDGRAVISSAQGDRATPWLATAGAGDVLAGFITGLLARNFDPMLAAECAAWLHVECARNVGPGLIAEDLPEVLPAVFRDMGV